MRVSGSSDERRAAPRYDDGAFVEQMVCRVNPGHDVDLVNVSSAGACVEAGFALLPGRPLQLHARARERRVAIEARVVWCRVTAVIAGRGVRYTAGLSFMRSIDLTKEFPLVRELAPTNAVVVFAREGTVPRGS